MKNRQPRKANRLQKYDYSRPGHYFGTICAWDRRNKFGDVMNEKMRPNATGRIVAESWEWMGRQYDYVGLDSWVVMPNHLHGIVIIHDTCEDENTRRGGSRTARSKTLGRLIGAFKTVSTRRINEYHGASETKLWQRSFYDHIIRDDADLNRIREYIRNNPLKWAFDRYNLENRT